MTKRQQRLNCNKKLEEYWRELTVEGKAYMQHQVECLGLHELEVMADILSDHQDLFKPGYWRRVS